MIVASDDASNAAYNDGWQSGDNGGTGFGAWSLSTSGGTSGFFIGNSTNLSGGSGANINAAGESFGMFGQNPDQANAFRSFSAPLSVGQTFTIDLAVNFRNGQKGLTLSDASNLTLFNLNVTSDNYFVFTPASGSNSIGNAYSSDTEFNLSFTQTSAAGGTWNLTRSGGVSDLDTGAYSGVPSNFTLYVGGTDGGSPNDFFANNLSISAIPEPGAFVFGALALSAVGLTYRVRRARKA